MRILITGANRGLGLSLSEEVVRRGHHVLAGVRNLDNGAEQLHNLKNNYADKVTLLQLDVTVENSVIRAAEEVKARFGTMDALINNAAILLARDRTIEELDMKMMEQTMDVNVYGPMRMAKYFVPLIRENGSGCILNISSESGSFHRAYEKDYPYAISKTALNMFTQRLHKGLAGEGIRAIAVHPGWMRTDMGGPNAALDPDDTAKALIEIIEGKQVETEPFAFVDYTGKSFPI